jgi:hypothetical protein
MSENVTIIALRKEVAVRQASFDKALAESDEYLSIHKRQIEILEELNALIKSNGYSADAIKQTKDMQNRQARINAVQKKDFMKLMDAKIEAQIALQEAQDALAHEEFREDIRKGRG